MKHFSLLAIFSFLLFPTFSFAASGLEVSGWIPYWEKSAGIRDARSHLDELTEINPFGFIVRADGTLNDMADIEDRSWERLFRRARREKVEIIPTVMWSNGVQIHTVLSNEKLRKEHVEEIADMVDDGDFDGVDIDYEGKLYETNSYFSLFLKELKEEIGKKKTLSCTIEARTPPDSLYTVVPPTIQYANNLAAIALYCDQVKIMAYDQQRADMKLNSQKKGAPYYPIADTDWVKKVLDLMLQTLPKEKVMLGVPTYGREVMVTVAPDWYKGYTGARAVNPDLALDVAKDAGVKPNRNKAGELSYSYIPNNGYVIPSYIKAPVGTPSGEITAARALAYANVTGRTYAISYVSWSDAEAIKDKVELAKQYGVRGIAIFKIDGGGNEDIWDLFD